MFADDLVVNVRHTSTCNSKVVLSDSVNSNPEHSAHREIVVAAVFCRSTTVRISEGDDAMLIT